MGVAVDPLEHDPPLVIDANRIETLKISPEFFQAVRWRHSQVIAPGRGIDELELSFGRPSNALKVADESIFKQILGAAIIE
jgi:hypothetical protein